jgi:hypothetical protein
LKKETSLIMKNCENKHAKIMIHNPMPKFGERGEIGSGLFPDHSSRKARKKKKINRGFLLGGEI